MIYFYLLKEEISLNELRQRLTRKKRGGGSGGLGKRRNQANKSRNPTSPRVKANAEPCTKTARHSCTLFSLKNDLPLHAALRLFPHQRQSPSFNKSIPSFWKGPIPPVTSSRGCVPGQVAPNFHSRQRRRLSCLEWKSTGRPGSGNPRETRQPLAKTRPFTGLSPLRALNPPPRRSLPVS